MRHIPLAFDLLGILATLYVLLLMLDTKTKGLRATSWLQARITRDELSRVTYSLLASANVKPHRSSFDPAYVRWWAEFVPFEARCFGTLREFVRLRFDVLLDHYYREGHASLNDFPSWAFERYLREAERTDARADVRRSREARPFFLNKRSIRRRVL